MYFARETASRKMPVVSFRTFTASICLGTLAITAQAGIINQSILSGDGWKSNEAAVSDWETLGFDDASWIQAYGGYPCPTTPGDLIPGTAASHMWHYPSGTPNGADGPIEAFFRYSFSLDLTSASLPILGQALISVDDDYEFYVNGHLAFENKDGGNAQVRDFVDFTSLLRNGDNLFAIHAVDGGWGAPFDRSFERVLFDGTVKTVAVPEPGSFVLLGLGLLGMVYGRRRLFN